MAERSPSSSQTAFLPSVRSLRTLMVCVAAFLFLPRGFTGVIPAAAASASATLFVSVTVVRSCSVDSGPAAGSVRLACANAVAPVRVSSGAVSSIHVLGAGLQFLTTPPPSRSSAEAQVITLNF